MPREDCRGKASCAGANDDDVRDIARRGTIGSQAGSLARNSGDARRPTLVSEDTVEMWPQFPHRMVNVSVSRNVPMI